MQVAEVLWKRAVERCSGNEGLRIGSKLQSSEIVCFNFRKAKTEQGGWSGTVRYGQGMVEGLANIHATSKEVFGNVVEKLEHFSTWAPFPLLNLKPYFPSSFLPPPPPITANDKKEDVGILEFNQQGWKVVHAIFVVLPSRGFLISESYVLYSPSQNLFYTYTSPIPLLFPVLL